MAGTPWLDVHCPGCGTSRAIDVRKLDRHPLASVGTLGGLATAALGWFGFSFNRRKKKVSTSARNPKRPREHAARSKDQAS